MALAIRRPLRKPRSRHANAPAAAIADLIAAMVRREAHAGCGRGPGGKRAAATPLPRQRAYLTTFMSRAFCANLR